MTVHEAVDRRVGLIGDLTAKAATGQHPRSSLQSSARAPNTLNLALMNSNLADRITISAAQCHGSPCIRGMRIRVIDVLEMLATGISEGEILADFPDLEQDDIRASVG